MIKDKDKKEEEMKTDEEIEREKEEEERLKYGRHWIWEGYFNEKKQD